MLTNADLAKLQASYARMTDLQANLQAVQTCLQQLAAQRLPTKALPNMTYSARTLYAHPELLPLDAAMAELRPTLIERFGLWCLPNQTWIQDLMDWLGPNRPVYELMAGNAALSAALQAAGYPCQASDQLDWTGQDNERPAPWTTVCPLTATDAVQAALADCTPESRPVFLLAWAPDTTEADAAVLTQLRSSGLPFDLVVIGEYLGATNSQRFWEMATISQPAQLNRHYQSFDYIEEAVYLVH
ncbi:SAM-dependent methyltransferase [Leuconostocaceae bacterium ESL0958]|nr:SAM-dependent methyltransferase [Leuconostocaceae bacterium ESL0958]